MALTLPRWIAAAVAGFLIIAASFFSKTPKAQRSVSHRDSLVLASNRAAWAATGAVSTLRAMMLRDSVRAAVARMPASDTSRMLVSSAVPVRLRGYDRVLGTRLATVRSQLHGSAIDLAFVTDTTGSLRMSRLSRSLMGVTHSLPRTPSERCTSIVRHESSMTWYNQNNQRYWASYLTSASTAARVLGPCGFYEAFGNPGPGIDQWLMSGAWRFGSTATIRQGRMLQLDLDRNYYYYYYGAKTLWALKAGWPLRAYVSPAGYRCASGDAEVCRRLILDPNSDPQGRRLAHVLADRLVAHTSVTDEELYLSLGPGEPQYLADMASMLGPDRFKAFWKSDKPTAEAFQAATGQDIGAWTVDWARTRYGVNSRGPGADTWTAAMSLLLAFVGLGAAIATSRRRQMA